MQNQPGQRLADARRALEAGHAARAVELATAALNVKLDPALQSQAQVLLAEAHFRAAAATSALEQRLAHLESAVRVQPQQARLHHFAGATLLRLGRAAAAQESLSAALALDSTRPGLQFMVQLARAAAGETWDEDGLSAAEINSLRLAQTLANGAAGTELVAGFAGQPLVGQADGLWACLLQMAAEPKSAPAARYANELAAAPHLARNPIAAYYAGVVALRKGDKETALTIWRRLADEGALATPWFKENISLLAREEAIRLAEAQQWEATVALQPTPSRTADGAATDSVLAEILAIAHFHLGTAAADAGRWAQAAHHWQQANRLVTSRHIAQNLALAQERLGNWRDAAAAWREMVRRRPRKTDDPNFLSDAQVTAIWRHAADCYAQIDDRDEEIACLKNALKYSEHDPELRLRLVDACMADDRVAAARSELERLLEIAPDHMQALLRLAVLYDSYGFGDSMPLWRRVLALDPGNQDARDGLARRYLLLARPQQEQGIFGRWTKRSEKQQIKVLQDGLKEVPDHPDLLLAIGSVQMGMGDNRAARGTLRRAWEVGRTRPEIVGSAMHDLLHAEGAAIVEELLPTARAIPGLMASFWTQQAEQAIACELGEHWIARFCDEALAQATLRHGNDSPAFAFILIGEALASEGVPEGLLERWDARARAEAGQAGLGEFFDAARAARSGDTNNARTLLRRARRLAAKANEPAVVEHIQGVEGLLSGKLPNFGALLDQMGPEELLDILDSLEGKGRKRR